MKARYCSDLVTKFSLEIGKPFELCHPTNFLNKKISKNKYLKHIIRPVSMVKQANVCLTTLWILL